MLIDQLYELAAASKGYFTTRQATDLGIDPKAVSALARRGRLVHVSHGTYRIARFPESEFDHLVEALLWPLVDGTMLCRESALVAYGISDANPHVVHVRVPLAYRTHRRVPEWLNLHPMEVEKEEVWDWQGLKVTSPARTIADCRDAHVRADIIEGAVGDAISLGLLSPRDISRGHDGP